MDSKIENVTLALQTFYAKNDKLNVPFREDDLSEAKPFNIKGSYRNLALLRPSADESYPASDRFESSLAQEQKSLYGAHCPISVEQLLLPIGDAREIRRVLISGPAGIGKSTLCHLLAYLWSQGQMFGTAQGKMFDAVFWLTFKEVPLLPENKLSLQDWIYQSCFDDDVRVQFDITVNDIEQIIFKTNRSRCILILDGFDEVSSLLSRDGDPRQKLLKTALSFQNVIVTTRPYGRSLLNQIGFDREVEDVGFSDESIKDFIKHYFQHANETEQSEALWNYIQEQPILKRIASIPLQTYFLCFVWMNSLRQNRAQKNSIRLTDVYRLFVCEIWMRRERARGRGSLTNFESLENEYADEIKYLSKIAFYCFTHDEEQLVITASQLVELIQNGEALDQLLERGFVRRDQQGHYCFIHLTMQEFFTAYQIYLHLVGLDEHLQAEALHFVSRNKYHMRYEIVVTFLIGLINREGVSEKVKKLLWDALFVFDLDLIGIRHAQLIMRALEESGRLSGVESYFSEEACRIDPKDSKEDRRCKKKHKENVIMLDQLLDWVLSSVQGDEGNFYSKLRAKFVKTLIVCPLVANKVFRVFLERYKGKIELLWKSLSLPEQKILLSDYWLPLLNHLPKTYTDFLVTLVITAQKDSVFHELFRAVDWGALKKSSARAEILGKITATILETRGQSTLANRVKGLLPVSLSLLQEGDTPNELLKFMEEHDESWMQWGICLAKAILEPSKKIHFLEKLVSVIKQKNDESNEVLLLLPVLSDWSEPREQIINLWWALLEEEDLVLHLRVVHRLEQLLDKNSKGNRGYKNLQHEVWKRSFRPNVESVDKPVLYREERFRLLLRLLEHDDENVILLSISALKQCNVNNWNEHEREELITMLLNRTIKQLNEYCYKDIIKLLGVLGQENLEALILALCEIKDSYKLKSYEVSKFLAKTIQFDKAISALQKALDNNDEWVREVALWCLWLLGTSEPEKVIQYMLKALKNKDPEVRGTAAASLSGMGRSDPKKVIPSLLQVLEDSNEEVRRAAVESLGKLGQTTQPEISGLIDALQDKDDSVRCGAVESLGDLGQSLYQRVIPALVSVLDDKDEGVRTAVVAALDKVEETQPNNVLSGLFMAFQDKDEDVRAAASTALVQLEEFQSNNVIFVTLNLLEYGNSEIRKAAAELLEKIGQSRPEKVIPGFLKAVTDENWEVRCKAVKALDNFGQSQSEAVIPRLLKAVEDENREVRSEAVKALEKFGQLKPKKVIPGFLKAAEDENWEIRLVAVKALDKFGQLKPNKVIPVLLSMLEDENWDENWEIRCAVVQALGKIGLQYPGEVIPVLLKEIEDESREVRRVTVQALDKFFLPHSKNIMPGLLKAIEDNDKKVRFAAASVLCQVLELLSEEMISSLKSVIKEELESEHTLKLVDNSEELRKSSKLFAISTNTLRDRKKRLETLETLGYVGQEEPENAISELVEALEDSDNGIRVVAVKSLGAIGQRQPENALSELLKALIGKDDREQNSIFETMFRIGLSVPEKAIPILLMKLNEKAVEENVLKSVAALLGLLGQKHPEKVMPGLLSVLENENELARVAVIVALFAIGQVQFVTVTPILLMALKDRSEKVRETAVRALGEIGHQQPEKVIPVLLKALGDTDEGVRLAVAVALPNLCENADHCPVAFFEKLLTTDNLYIAAHCLPILINYQLKISVGDSSLFENPVSQQELFWLISEVINSKHRVAIVSQLKKYYRKYKNIFIDQLFIFLEQQLISVEEALLLAQLLSIDSIYWFKQLIPWVKGVGFSGQTSSPVICLAELLCLDCVGVSFGKSQNEIILCKDTELVKMTEGFSKEALDFLVEQIKNVLVNKRNPYLNIDTYLKRNLPVLLPRSKAKFFSRSHVSPHDFQAINTYYLTRRIKKSINCQDWCNEMFSVLGNLNVINMGFELLSDPASQFFKIKIKEAKAFNDAMLFVTEVSERGVIALDLSDNDLTDAQIILLCEYLNLYDNCRILKLSRNAITVDGLSSLILSMQEKRSLLYLLLDNNWISFDVDFCSNLEELLETTGLIHVDLSLNYIPQGQLIEGKILDAPENLRSTFGDNATYCQRMLNESLKIHSVCETSQVSLLKRHMSNTQLQKEFDKINLSQGCIGLAAYLDPYLDLYGTHSFLLIERIIPEYGQRQLLVADLVINEANRVQIRVVQVSPTAYFEHLGAVERVGCRLALADSQKINNLLQSILHSRNARDFAMYKVIPKKKGTVNCHKQAVQWLVDSGIISKAHEDEWVHIEPEHSSCTIV